MLVNGRARPERLRRVAGIGELQPINQLTPIFLSGECVYDRY
jgi:hypothetical protein